MYEAILLDFYGTVVHEDDVVIDQICRTISLAAGRPASVTDIGSYWWDNFSGALRVHHGERFQTQRILEQDSLAKTCRHYGAECDTAMLSEMMFDHWQNAPLFDDAKPFLAAIDLPVVVLSNIDRQDIEAVIAMHQLSFDHVFTSEDVRSYKPRPELFQAGLEALGLGPSDVLHVGDSTTSDVAGANDLGIPVAWVNRIAKVCPTQAKPDYEVAGLTDLIPVLNSAP